MTFDDHLAKTLFKKVRRPEWAPKPVPVLVKDWDEGVTTAMVVSRPWDDR